MARHLEGKEGKKGRKERKKGRKERKEGKKESTHDTTIVKNNVQFFPKLLLNPRNIEKVEFPTLGLLGLLGLLGN